MVQGTPREAPKAYAVEVCLTCGVLAKWPFCPHRQEQGRWTTVISCRPTPSGRARLQAEMDERAKQ